MKTIYPYQTIGIIGGGQLARMMCIAAKAMGYYTVVLDPTPNCPAGQVSDGEITAAYDDLAAIKRLAEITDIITYEFENIDVAALEWLCDNAYLPQGSETLRISRHRFLEKTTISKMGIPVAEFLLINDAADFDKKVADNLVTYPSILKTTTLGYDGKGQIVLRSEADLPHARALAESSECILEKFVDFEREVSVIVARSTTGEVKTFPVAENIHVNNILHLSIVPARVSDAVAKEAEEVAKTIASSLGSVGVMGVEMFVTAKGIVVNEIAPRPHNSGHFSIDACITSQFEQHIRAVCGLPLGVTDLHTPVVMVNILGNHMNKEQLHDLSRFTPLLPHGKLHLYGKAAAVDGRKMGHFNVLGDVENALEKINAAKIWD